MKELWSFEFSGNRTQKLKMTLNFITLLQDLKIQWCCQNELISIVIALQARLIILSSNMSFIIAKSTIKKFLLYLKIYLNVKLISVSSDMNWSRSSSNKTLFLCNSIQNFVTKILLIQAEHWITNYKVFRKWNVHF